MDYEKYSASYEEYDTGEIPTDFEYRIDQEHSPELDYEEYNTSEMSPDFGYRLFQQQREKAAFFGVTLIHQRNLRYAVAVAVTVALRYKIAHSSGHARAYRSPSRSRRVNADSGGGGDGDDGSGQGGPDSSDPPKQAHFVISPTRNLHSPASPWPSHGCCCVKRGWAV
jgi:hypothetical protein